jgi:cell wall-associated NlpC family hydrolase
MRDIALQITWAHLNEWYRWGGDDPSGFDCSGFIVEILKSVGLIGRDSDYSAQSLWNQFKSKQVPTPKAGTLVFFGKSKDEITHIEMCIGKGLSIGASGGDSSTLTVEDAIIKNAFIKIRPIISRNPHWIGFIDLFD